MLSILIPTYNYNILPLVSELKKQCDECEIQYEIIVLDDNSSEEETFIKNSAINNYQHCKIIRNKVNLGRTKTRNILAEQANYPWLLFLDADVIPVENNFIQNYINSLNLDFDVILGGYEYEDYPKNSNTILRWKYGKSREFSDAKNRNLNTYGYIFSGNILIKKTLFKSIHLPEKNHYGMDVLLAYFLFINKVNVLHINNTIYHLGLDDDKTFFKKSIESVDLRKTLLDKPEIEKINSLIKHYKILKKLRLVSLFAFFFMLSKSFLKQLILSKNPNLFCLDIYRLGYLCTLK